MTLVPERAGTQFAGATRALERELATETVLRRAAAENHLDRHAEAIALLRAETPRLVRWGLELARALVVGRRLLVAGNGGSAAEAQHLTSELVGKMDQDRMPLSAIALHAEGSSVTAIANDYGYEQVFARQVTAHGREGDILMLLSTSGRSPNLLAAAAAARERGVTSWAMTGPLPNPLALRCDDVLALPACAPTVQELHLVAVHVLCAQIDAALPARNGGRP